jgi:hypothetical protein
MSALGAASATRVYRLLRLPRAQPTHQVRGGWHPGSPLGIRRYTRPALRTGPNQPLQWSESPTLCLVQPRQLCADHSRDGARGEWICMKFPVEVESLGDVTRSGVMSHQVADCGRPADAVQVAGTVDWMRPSVAQLGRASDVMQPGGGDQQRRRRRVTRWGRGIRSVEPRLGCA